MKKNKIIGSSILGIVMSLLSVPAFAASTWADIASDLTNQFGSYASFVLGIAFLSGIVITCFGVAKLIEKSKNPQVKGSSILIMFVAGVFLIAVPTFITMSTNTIFGTSHISSDTSGSNYNQIQ